MQMESMTDRLNVLTNVLDVPTDLVRIKSGGAPAPLPPPLGHTNALDCALGFVTVEQRLSWQSTTLNSQSL